MPRESEIRPQGGAAALFAEHADTVARWVGHLGGPLVDVDDVVQDVFLTVHRRFVRFRGDATVVSWLYGITANVVREHRRRARRRRWFGIGQPADATTIARQPTPVEELERRQRAVAVYETLERMREHHRDVLILSELEGLDGDEIATLTGVKVGSVWVRLHRARQEFAALARRHMSDELDTLRDITKRRGP